MSALVVPFTPEHLAALRPKVGEAEEIAGMPGVAARLAQMGAKTILASTAGPVLGIMGLTPVLPGVCEVFVLATRDQAVYPISFAKSVRKELYTLREKYRRIQAIARDDGFHARWLGWLGLEKEGVLRKFGLHGEDMAMWSLTKI